MNWKTYEKKLLKNPNFKKEAKRQEPKYQLTRNQIQDPRLTLKGIQDFLPSRLKDLGVIAVFIDAANIQKSSEKLGWKINYKHLIRLIQSSNKILSICYYTVEPKTQKQRAFIRSLRRFGYQVFTKPLKIIRSRNQSIRKANFDVEIASDIVTAIDKFETLLLFSGDSDFTYSLKLVKQKKKKSIVISTRYRVSRELVETSDFYLDLRKLRKQLERK